MSPKVSVIMSVYNRPQYLPDCIESILGQTFSDFEFIIIDDASDGKTFNLIQQYALKDKRIILIKNEENLGVAKARNKGLEKAKGEFIAVMDSDDVALPNRLTVQVEYLQKHPECVAVGSEVLYIDPQGWPISIRGQKTEHDDIKKIFLNGRGGAIVHPTAMIPRSVFQRIGGYNSELAIAPDYDLFIRLLDLGKLVNLPNVLLKFRQHFDRISDKKRDVQLEIARDTITRVWQEKGWGKPPDNLFEKPKVFTSLERREQWARRAFEHHYYLTSCKHSLVILFHKPRSQHIRKLAFRSLIRLFCLQKISLGIQLGHKNK